MSLRRRASLSGVEMTSNDLRNPARGDNFRRRMSLASLGTRKYGRSVDSDSEGVVEEGREVERKVIVRHVPIVIEGSEGDCEVKAEKARQINTSQSKDQISFSKFSQAWNIPDDLSSLGSLTSENSLDSISRLDRIEEVVRAWMMRTEEEESRGRTENCGGRAGSSKIENKVVTPKTSDLTRKPFSDISQNRISNQRKAPLQRRVPEGNYLNKTDTGPENCPVHKQGLTDNGEKVSISDNTSMALKTPSLLRSSTRIKHNSGLMDKSETGRPKHITKYVPILKAKENRAADNSQLKTSSRGPGQWSFRGYKFRINENKSDDDKTQNKSQNSKTTFQRSWSLRKPSSNSENIPSSIQSVPRPSQIRTDKTFVGVKTESESNNRQITPMKKYSSQNDHNVQPKKTTQSHKTRMAPSVSTSSIPSMVSKEYAEVPISKPPCVGILKTPGKRKISSNNRVEFLNNVREREIPGRHA